MQKVDQEFIDQWVQQMENARKEAKPLTKVGSDILDAYIAWYEKSYEEVKRRGHNAKLEAEFARFISDLKKARNRFFGEEK